ITRHMKPAFVNIGIDPCKAVFDSWINADYPNDLKLGDNFGLINGYFEKVIWELLEEEKELSEEDIFIYLDPPYPLDSRKDNRPRYPHEMTDEQHINMLVICKLLRCKIAISTYSNKLYRSYLKNWRLLEFQSNTRRGMATEHLYMNYPEPTELHDYSYLGENASEREDIRLRFERFKNKFSKKSALEQSMWRQYLINKI
ncbi:MAG: hypothetical protein AAGJ18_21015, partial [Bacteroidota bacterium]